MATPLTPQQIADATAKRVATAAANRAAGVSVRQQRAAAKAAKAGQPAPPPPAPKAAPHVNPFGQKASRRRRRSSWGAAPAAPPKATAPVFAAPKPNYRALRLAALAALEAVFVAKVSEQGVTQELRDGYAKYTKCKTLALGATTTDAMRNEADAGLRMATAILVRLAF